MPDNTLPAGISGAKLCGSRDPWANDRMHPRARIMINGFDFDRLAGIQSVQSAAWIWLANRSFDRGPIPDRRDDFKGGEDPGSGTARTHRVRF